MLKAEKETKKLLAKESRIELQFEKLITEITEYDIKYGNSKNIPIPVISCLEIAMKEFEIMKYNLRFKNRM